jgi:hypothetical protein
MNTYWKLQEFYLPPAKHFSAIKGEKRMKTAFVIAVIVFSISFLGMSYAFSGKMQSEHVMNQKLELGAWRGSQLMGIVVYGADGNRVGAIADLIGDVKGKVIYVILSHGGVLGIGDKLIPLPWDQVSPGEKAGTLKVRLTKKALEQVPNFDSDNWPDFNQSEWNTKMQKYYEGLQSRKVDESR